MVQVNLVPVVESQSPRQRISNVNRKFFLQIRKVCAGWLAGCPEYLDIISLIHKRSRWSEELSDELEYGGGWFGKCPDSLKSVGMV